MIKKSLMVVMFLSMGFGAAVAAVPPPAAPAQGERIVLLGNGLAERMFSFDHFETELHLRFPNQELIIRNMGRQADTTRWRPAIWRRAM